MYYFSDMADKAQLKPIPPAPRPPRQPMSQMEQVYLALLVHWYRHRDRAPRLTELAALTKPNKTPSTIRAALLQLEAKGYVRRNDDGRFEVIP